MGTEDSGDLVFAGWYTGTKNDDGTVTLGTSRINTLSKTGFTGDIDLYVGKEAASKAAELCLASFGEGEHDAESSKHFHFDNEGVSIEIHKIAENLPGHSEDRRYQEWTVRHLTGPDCRTVEIAGTDVKLPPVPFDAIYTY